MFATPNRRHWLYSALHECDDLAKAWKVYGLAGADLVCTKAFLDDFLLYGRHVEEDCALEGFVNNSIKVGPDGRMTDPIAAKMYLNRADNNSISWVLTRFTEGVRGRSRNVLPDDGDAHVL